MILAILYFIIAFILSVVGAYYDYHNFYSHEDIKTYFDNDFKLSIHIGMWILCFIFYDIYTICIYASYYVIR